MTKTRDLSDFLIEGGADLPLGKPHIVPDVLYPAVSGNDINGTDIDTSHGSTYTYGELHTDGRKYYYTDIKGSKPIKDPRIGGHFGSQRHKIKSLQLLEQETATHGKNVYSIDGREWVKAIGDWNYNNDSGGVGLRTTNSGDGGVTFIEVIGYFNDFNFLTQTQDNADQFTVVIDGGSALNTDFGVTVNTPLGARYVDKASVLNMEFNGGALTLGIHTIKIYPPSSNWLYAFGFELIAQDTSNRNNIQIPSQNVVSFGKKFNVSGTPHYNPFNNQTIGDNTSHGKNTVGWTTYDSTLDTATSLGLDAWVDSGNYYRPVNGGRIVKWVDSSGNIKTSVNMMPPSAKAIGSHSGNSGPHQTAWTSTYQPVFSSGAIDHSQAEVAKTFHFREFGNGNANGGTNSSSYADFSMVSGTDDEIAYVMDDGLTSAVTDHGFVNGATEEDTLGIRVAVHTGVQNTYFTFIGTGFSAELKKWSDVTFDAVGNQTLVQNLPYGTHIVKLARDNTGTDEVTLTVDGVVVQTEAFNVDNEALETLRNLTFHQPKRPPIPEDACVIADYMLMADFVPQTTAGIGLISKGVRSNSASRDVFYNDSGGNGFDTLSPATNQHHGLRVANSSAASSNEDTIARLPSFGTNYVIRSFSFDARHRLYVDSDSSTSAHTHSGTGYESFGYLTTAVDLGNHKFGVNALSGQALNISAFEIAAPIHTSSHYQTFETPFLHELVGGDRNMEQTNLVCSSDGKTWDQITRDTSYIGNGVLAVSKTDGDVTTNQTWKFTETRGNDNIAGLHQYNKNWALAYDKFICLVDGNYNFVFHLRGRSSGGTIYSEIALNGVRVQRGSQDADGTAYRPNMTLNVNLQCQRGDRVNVEYDDGEGQSAVDNQFIITKL